MKFFVEASCMGAIASLHIEAETPLEAIVEFLSSFTEHQLQDVSWGGEVQISFCEPFPEIAQYWKHSGYMFFDNGHPGY